MSAPISWCQIHKAALGDQQAFERLVDDMEYNRTQVMFTILPCECQPPCPKANQEQLEALKKRVNDAVDARFEKRHKAYTARPIGDFSKWIFPVIKNMRWRSPWYQRFWYWVRGKPDPYDLKQCILAQPMKGKNEE
jgi:hypothetical protein